MTYKIKFVPIFIIWVLICGLLALGISVVLNVPFLMMFGLIGFGLITNSLIAEIEDRVDGGFLSPEGTATPRWVHVVSKIARSILGGAIFAMGIVLFFVLPEQSSRVCTWVLRGAIFLGSLFMALMLVYRKRARLMMWMAIAALPIGIGFALVSTKWL